MPIFRFNNALGKARGAKAFLSPKDRVTRNAVAHEPGALPDFVVIGAKKCGTTFLYNLLTQHPHVQPAARKELRFFNNSFDKGVEWYRRRFPQPKWKDGRMTITGEATPEYLTCPPPPERMAEVVPQARLIVLLRNPVDRAYSDYQQRLRKERESRTFERAVGLEGAGTPSGNYVSRGIYVDKLLRWSEFFGDEQMLVLKSEDFFERPVETLKIVLNFLGLPEWEPGVLERRQKRRAGRYKQKMDPATRRWLEDYFEPHNRRLYDYLGVDFGW